LKYARECGKWGVMGKIDLLEELYNKLLTGEWVADKNWHKQLIAYHKPVPSWDGIRHEYKRKWGVMITSDSNDDEKTQVIIVWEGENGKECREVIELNGIEPVAIRSKYDRLIFKGSGTNKGTIEFEHEGG